MESDGEDFFAYVLRSEQGNLPAGFLVLTSSRDAIVLGLILDVNVFQGSLVPTKKPFYRERFSCHGRDIKLQLFEELPNTATLLLDQFSNLGDLSCDFCSAGAFP